MDLISRRAALDALNASIIFGRCNEKTVTFKALKKYAEGVRERIEALPSAQPEIIRCKDCTKYQFSDNHAFGFSVKRCEVTGFEVVDDDFCSRAWRRKDD